MTTPERRRSRRVRLGQPVHVRPTDLKRDPFDDIGKTENASKDGFYFITPKDLYYPGMRLFVMLPYYGPNNPQNVEHVAQVARVDQRDDGRVGIAVQFLGSSKQAHAEILAGAHRR